MNLRFTIAIAAAAFLAGCTIRPVLNVNDAPVVTAARPATMQDVQTAIVRAGNTLGWQMTPVRPGLVAGRLELRTHVAVVDVAYDTRAYSIRYKDSVNLDAGGGN
ncbi:MAG: hypothetical protein ABI585_01970, partial [Betaproteobacteria bacterium]